jgi:putative hydrolase of the HAD superfamily
VIDIIAFDADDTLWHNETLYRGTEKRFQQLLAAYQAAEETEQALFQTEMRNLRLYGYGIKSFGLSMIETAIQVSKGRIAAYQIQEIIDLAKEMLETRVELLDHVADVIPSLAQRCRLMLVTKGDLRDQEAKLAGSGLAHYFDHVEIVPDKNVEVYRSLLARNNVAPQQFLMVGNSLRSDVLPVVELGGHAVHIPYHITWAHEAVQVPHGNQGDYAELAHIGLLPAYVEGLCRPSK